MRESNGLGIISDGWMHRQCSRKVGASNETSRNVRGDSQTKTSSVELRIVG